MADCDRARHGVKKKENNEEDNSNRPRCHNIRLNIRAAVSISFIEPLHLLLNKLLQVYKYLDANCGLTRPEHRSAPRLPHVLVRSKHSRVIDTSV